MMKKLLISGLLISVSFGLMGCTEGKIVYDGVERPVSEVEDILGDMIEMENPGMDIEVSIYEESD